MGVGFETLEPYRRRARVDEVLVVVSMSGRAVGVGVPPFGCTLTAKNWIWMGTSWSFGQPWPWANAFRRAICAAERPADGVRVAALCRTRSFGVGGLRASVPSELLGKDTA